MKNKNLAKRFEDAYREKTKLAMRRHELSGKLMSLLKSQEILRVAINKNTIKEEIKIDTSDYPIILGNAIYRMSVTNIGILPPMDRPELVTSNCIYPVGFVCKKKYKAHSKVKKKLDKIVYICTVDEKQGLRIIADDGVEWSGKSVWDDFRKEFDSMDEYHGIREFFGLNHPVLIKKIEALGDVKMYTNYIPYNERSKEDES